MDGETLTFLAEKKLDDLTGRYLYFKELGDEEMASFMAEEGLELSLAIETNSTFFCLPALEDFYYGPFSSEG